MRRVYKLVTSTACLANIAMLAHRQEKFPLITPSLFIEGHSARVIRTEKE
jgi:hypothetical protein